MSNENSNETIIVAEPENNSIKTTETSLDALVNSIRDDAPEPSGVNVAPVANQIETPSGFNAQTHETNSDGSPKLTPTGRFKKRKKLSNTAFKKPDDIEPETVEQKLEAHIQVTGAMYTHTAIALLTMFFGTEWQAQKHEQTALVEATTNYCRLKGITQASPEAILFVAWAGYAIPRFQQPETQSRLKKLTERLKLKYQEWKVRKMMKFGQETAPVAQK